MTALSCTFTGARICSGSKQHLSRDTPDPGVNREVIYKLEGRDPLEKRIKRHIIGRTREFFATTAPGLEGLCLDELKSLPLSIEETTAISGGVEFKGHLHECYLANLCLHTTNRILMRVDSFRASNFNRLEKVLSRLPWELFLFKEFIPKVDVTSRHSRLYHKTAIAERIRSSLKNRSDQTPFLSATEKIRSIPQHLFVRIADDRFTISIDSSGELLHKRGIKKLGARAPMRETLAAAALKIAGYDIREPLIDPMCGSGTFSLEAAMMSRNIPAGWYRNFAFMGWPCFRSTRWNHLRREAEKMFRHVDHPLIFASDKDPKMCEALNGKIREYGLTGAIKTSNRDFFDLSPHALHDRTGLVVINPPYGVRMETRKESRKLFHRIIGKLGKEYKGWRLALFVSERRLIYIVPFDLTPLILNHGGLRLTLLTGRIT